MNLNIKWIGRNRMAVIAAVVGALAVILTAPNGYAAPQQKDASDSSSIQALMDELDDIDFARSVTPLKLSGEQIDKLITTITDAKAQYDKKISELGEAAFGKYSDEIHKRHKAVLAGGDPSKVFDDKVKGMMSDFLARRERINGDNLFAVATATSKILTADQKKIAVQMEKDILSRNGKLDATEKDSKFYNLYVVDVFIGYRRIVPLLKEIKANAAP